MKRFLPLFLSLFPLLLTAQNEAPTDSIVYQKVPKTYRYRVSFTDKKNCGYSTKHPEAFLSQKALDRRKRLGAKVDSYDLPITPQYLRTLTEQGFPIYNRSKWNNTAVVTLSDTTRLSQLRAFPFVKAVRKVWESPDSIPVPPATPSRQSLVTNKRDTLATYYGRGERQVTMLGIDSLHRAGYRGRGVTIAVIDGGFYNADIIDGLKNVRVLGTRNFVHPGVNVYEEAEHGMMVLSCIAANTPYSLVGTAPEASFYLLVSEDGATEQLVEEDNWCAAMEYADSLGCDIVTSSLGYYLFDHKTMNHCYNDLDGQTAINSRNASLAASRGLLVINSAGNSGMSRWKKIGFPADARDMLAIGAVDSLAQNAAFSSLGNSADGRIKPNVMAMGVNSAVYDVDGTVARVNGTSFACPTLCGAVACLLQMFPYKKPTEIIHAVQQSGNNAQHPDNIYGYGIPNMPKAANLLRGK